MDDSQEVSLPFRPDLLIAFARMAAAVGITIREKVQVHGV
jgi:hypothetical protein